MYRYTHTNPVRTCGKSTRIIVRWAENAKLHTEDAPPRDLGQARAQTRPEVEHDLTSQTLRRSHYTDMLYAVIEITRKGYMIIKIDDIYTH